MYKKILIFLFFLGYLNEEVLGFGGHQVCYRCHSSQPGCGVPFDWFLYWSGEYCPEYDDVCVKLIETKGAETYYTRDCLSRFQKFRRDIPADKYEGCYPSAKYPLLAHYVFNDIEEYDIRRDHFNTTWCFCHLDNRCNSAASFQISAALVLLSIVFYHIFR